MKVAHQARAEASLTAALESGPSHAYLFRGPRGAGKRAAARAFAAEILAAGAEDPEDARRRALLDPSPHPDLVWLAPTGAQHMVEAVRERVIRAASYRPFEGSSRVFVLESAEAMRDESQNALLKTLEEPPGFAHLILLSSEPEALLETIASRCQPVEFSTLPLAAVEDQLEGDPDQIAAAARLSAGDIGRAKFLLSRRGKKLRAAALGLAGEMGPASAKAGVSRVAGPASAKAQSSGESGPTTRSDPKPWGKLLKAAEEIGSDAEGVAREALESDKEAGIKRTAKEMNDEAKRVGRRQRTAILDFGLGLCAGWFRDLAAVGAGAEEVVFNRDLLPQLRAVAEGLDPGDARRGAELVQDTRRRLDLNVSEELALEALCFRLEDTVGL